MAVERGSFPQALFGRRGEASLSRFDNGFDALGNPAREFIESSGTFFLRNLDHREIPGRVNKISRFGKDLGQQWSR
jgi:hypothetical protein